MVKWAGKMIVSRGESCERASWEQWVLELPWANYAEMGEGAGHLRGARKAGNGWGRVASDGVICLVWMPQGWLPRGCCSEVAGPHETRWTVLWTGRSGEEVGHLGTR